MTKLNIAIIGLGRIGSVFLHGMQENQNINIFCVAEHADTPAKAQAESAGIVISTLDEIVGMSEMLDIIFDLTGIADVRKELREKLQATNNTHTVIATETIVHLIWSLISDEPLPVIEGRRSGY
jgi:predicted dinucleotide-utilizing enzyme